MYKKNLFEKGYFSSLAVATLLFAGVGAVFAWTPAPNDPPKNNVEAPINVSPVQQYKKGILGLNGLAVFGKVQIVDGTQGAGKVLVSDANGKASWQTLPNASINITNTTNSCGNPILASLNFSAPNNASSIKKVATLNPGTYTVEGSGTSYNTGGGGINTVFLYKGNIPEGAFTGPTAEMNMNKYYGNNCTSCAIANKIIYGKGDPAIYVYNRNGYNDGPWSIPAGTSITISEKVYAYMWVSQAGGTGSLEFTRTDNCK